MKTVPDPAYYSSLAPFRELFARGLPILTYHKLGPRPRGTRMKGLCLGEKLFARQMAELRAASFTSQSLDESLPREGNPNHRFVITFDDGFVNVLTHALAPLAANGFRAIQFIVAGRIGQVDEWNRPDGEVLSPLMDAAQIKDWLAAGHEIGSHTLTHPHLTKLPPAQAREEIAASKKKLEDLFGVAIRHFCYPYGDWDGRTRDLVLEAGYRTACTTSFGVNTSEAPPGALLRITARYPTRNWRTVAGKLADFFRGK
jgi:peptidoglycan/xylan/chitin deacetylase (PgdA/CDA1 family)